VRIERLVETWGTVVVIEATSSALDKVAVSAAVDEVEEFFFQVDQDFSTYKENSQVSRIRRGELKIEDASEYVQQVWALCEFSREITMGAFDPWKADGGFDPSGLVKGWAAEVGAQMLVKAGIENVLINASGDIVLRGGKHEGGPWNIGIASPDDVEKYVKFFDLVDGSVATSGDYEKGAHIIDPHTGLIAIGARSATVIGPDGAICDALATALMVDGVDAQKWIGRVELAEYSFWTINRHDGTAWSYGSNKGY
jgi:thiamine biosynthesis lipoprotein